MSDFADSSCCGGAATDPRKRANYTRGMVLGEDDLIQEQVYLRARDHLGVRALHGFGTVAGLQVRWDGASRRLQVASGLAVDPAGRLVCVDTDQCADLPAWLGAHRAELRTSIPGPLSLYVVLCYRECETDTVPVPSESCRSADESMAASRIQDSFELRLLLDPPVAAGEVAGGGLARAIDRILSILDSIPDDSLPDSLPGSLPRADAVRRRLAAWVTRQRPEVPDAACLPAPADNCGDRPAAPSTAVLLARVDLDFAEDPGGGVRLVSPPEVVDDERPILLSTRFLQEWLTELLLRPELFLPPPIDDHNLLRNLTVGDVHTQYLPVDGHRPLEGDLDAGGHALTRIARSAQPHHAVRADEVTGADLARSPAGARIDRLQGVPVQAAAPNPGDLLRFDGASWVPAPAPPPAGRLGPLLPLVTIHPMGRVLIGDQTPVAVFMLWFNIEVPKNSTLLVAPPGTNEALVYDRQFVVLQELCVDNVPNSRQIASNLVSVVPVSCNVFRVEIRRADAQLLRFVFQLRAMFVSPGRPMAEYTEDRRISWEGQDGADTVTKFVLNPSADKPTTGFEDVVAWPAPPGGPKFTVRGA